MKLELIASKDELRPVMNYIKVTRENCVSTDGHALGVIPSNEIFSAEFIAQIPEDGILIHSEDWKKLNNAVVIAFEDAEKLIIKVHYKKGRPVLFEGERESNVGKYPNWENVIPTPGGETPEMNINPELLAKLAKALNLSAVTMQFCGGINRAILVKQKLYKETPEDVKTGAYGLIMPLSA